MHKEILDELSAHTTPEHRQALEHKVATMPVVFRGERCADALDLLLYTYRMYSPAGGRSGYRISGAVLALLYDGILGSLDKELTELALCMYRRVLRDLDEAAVNCGPPMHLVSDPTLAEAQFHAYEVRVGWLAYAQHLLRLPR